jgi:SPX domain protein involved in polyphosphate accumulation
MAGLMGKRLTKLFMKNQDNYRYERKFLVSDIDRSAVLNAVKLNSLNFINPYPPRKINNIYFDSLDMKCFHDNIDGIANREKYRIRWYGEFLGRIERPVLEIKIRKNSVGRKEFYPLKPFSMDKNLTKKKILDVIRKSNIPILIKEKILQFTPTLVNGYSRTYFLSFDKVFRLTLDNDLFYMRPRSEKLISIEKFIDRKSTVVEVKYDAEDDEKVYLATKDFSFRMTKNSKYVTGVYKLYY